MRRPKAWLKFRAQGAEWRVHLVDRSDEIGEILVQLVMQMGGAA